LTTLDAPAYGAASDVTPKFVSPSDPAAQWTGALRNAKFFFVYVLGSRRKNDRRTYVGWTTDLRPLALYCRRFRIFDLHPMR
jgi:hypothetical protein